MKGSILSHIIDKMVRKENAERFDESFTAFLELGHYLFAHSKVANLHQVEFSKALHEAQAKIERVQVEVECLKMALEEQTAKADRLRKALRREEEVSIELRAALTLLKDKRNKTEEEVGTEKERAIKAFKSSKAMEDIKIAFSQEAFLEGLWGGLQ
ncbi:hypothetical protein COCNU_scaffold000934G000040 [Cocos nucifera]|nr:hypothetical protein [Cocos nucifera]